jgi:hypothetical protein
MAEALQRSQTTLLTWWKATEGARNMGGAQSACQLVVNIGIGTKIPGQSTFRAFSG